MDVSKYVGLSALLALEKRVNTIAHNVANASTTGFRAEEVKFEAVLSETSATEVAFASTGSTYLSREAGAVKQTGNPLDVAVQGDAWIAMQTPVGRVLTRDGRLEMGPDGALRTVTGHAILDVSGGALQLDPTAGPPTIARDGMISQGGNQVGAIGLFRVPAEAKLTRFENSGVIPDREPAPVLQFSDAGVLQGHLESSNVNPVRELTRLIAASRAFEAVFASLEANQATQKSAIRTLGSSS